MRKLKAIIQQRSGVKFTGLKTFRATAGQIAKDRGASIEAVARALRHSTTKTTERYYARVQTEDAFAEWERAMANPVKVRR